MGNRTNAESGISDKTSSSMIAQRFCSLCGKSTSKWFIRVSLTQMKLDLWFGSFVLLRTLSLVFSASILFVFPQINDLNRRVSALENFLNHLEQKVVSPYDQVNPEPQTRTCSQTSNAANHNLIWSDLQRYSEAPFFLGGGGVVFFLPLSRLLQLQTAHLLFLSGRKQIWRSSNWDRSWIRW